MIAFGMIHHHKLNLVKRTDGRNAFTVLCCKWVLNTINKSRAFIHDEIRIIRTSLASIVPMEHTHCPVDDAAVVNICCHDICCKAHL